jgi:uncharacterized protein YcaQ
MIESGETAFKLSAQQARNLHLHAQGLLLTKPGRSRRSDLLAAIERMHLLQIDTIHVVARSPYLVLFSRLGEYNVDWLGELLEAADIFECWSHEACFAPSVDFALHRAHHACGGRAGHWAQKHATRAQVAQRAGMDAVLAHIRDHGPAKAADFDSTKRGTSGWWSWKDEKRWLEALFARGELMVAGRERFQRVYDLAERVVARMRVAPADEGASAAEVSRVLILKSVKALGISQARWIADYFRTGRKHKDHDLDALVGDGELLRVDVRGWEWPGYVHRDHVDALECAAAGKLRATRTTLLSPFDPVVWDRARASALFGFDYTIECYVPEPKRKFGYFVLPILDRGRLVGRLDAKAHRAEGLFEVRSLHLEPGVEGSAALAERLAKAIQSSADWHGTPRVAVRRSDPKAFASALRSALQG